MTYFRFRECIEHVARDPFLYSMMYLAAMTVLGRISFWQKSTFDSAQPGQPSKNIACCSNQNNNSVNTQPEQQKGYFKNKTLRKTRIFGTKS